MRISDIFTIFSGYEHTYSGTCSSSGTCGPDSFERYEEHCYRYNNCCYAGTNGCTRSSLLGIL
jgi:hypothetical protein